MATINCELGKPRKDGSRYVAILVTQGKSRRRIRTDLILQAEDLTPKGKVRNKAKAHYIDTLVARLKDRMYEVNLDLLGQRIDADELIRRMQQKNRNIDFFEWADVWMGRQKLKGLKNYRSMLSALEKFLGERVLPMRLITRKLLGDFSRWLDDRPRAKSMYLSAMGHLYREAQAEFNTEAEQPLGYSPFDGFKMPRQVVRGRRAITREEVLRVYSYRGTGVAQLARDCFILSFCLMGMNSVDLFNARKMRDGMICYERTKTKDRRWDRAYIEVRVHPVLNELMWKYGDTARVFSFWRRYANYKNFQRSLNLGLKVVGEAVGVPGLQFYQARHSFATIMRNELRVARSDVDEALNHVSGTLADIYIKRDFGIINDENWRLMEYMFGKTEGEQKK